MTGTRVTEEPLSLVSIATEVVLGKDTTPYGASFSGMVSVAVEREASTRAPPVTFPSITINTYTHIHTTIILYSTLFSRNLKQCSDN